MKKSLLSLLTLWVATAALAVGATPEKVVTFRFVPGNDTFYIPWEGNDVQLKALYSIVDEYRSEIVSGEVPVYVDGYCASKPTKTENINIAFVRANRVKSELITHKGLVEANFVTRNYATAYEGHKDVVVVTIRIPVEEEPLITIPVREEPEHEQIQVVEPQPEPVVEETAPLAVCGTVPPAVPYTFAVRTNVLYDAFLLPTLGVEWRASRSIGVKVDGSYSFWGDEHGKVQKVWLVSPEVRWYMGRVKRFYLGVGGNIGEYNVYKYMPGIFISDDTGYQGKLWNAGLTVGYQARLTRSFSVDFNLGLGYTRFDYDSFNLVDGVRTYKGKDLTKNFWGPTQAGISLVWTIGGKNQ